MVFNSRASNSFADMLAKRGSGNRGDFVQNYKTKGHANSIELHGFQKKSLGLTKFYRFNCISNLIKTNLSSDLLDH